jgi:hypothetical protein
MRILLIALLVVPAALPAADPPLVPPRTGKSEVVALFNGKNLDGWVGYEDHWSVQNGEIVGKNAGPVAVSTYLLTKRAFTDFHLKFAAKLVESEMHSGVAFWGRVAPEAPPAKQRDRSKYTYAGHLVMFPSDYGLYDLFGRNGLKVDNRPAKKVGKQHDWNEMEIFAQGNRIRHIVNGVLVVDWRDPEPDRIREGPIGLQLHSNTVPQEVRFRGLTLTTYPDDSRLAGKKVGDAVSAGVPVRVRDATE